jgi:hypothetical protein
MNALVPNSIYRHYKGNLYKVICVAKHSETLEDVVVYQSQYGDFGFWVRPVEMFQERVLVEGNEVERFSLLEGVTLPTPPAPASGSGF